MFSKKSGCFTTSPFALIKSAGFGAQRHKAERAEDDEGAFVIVKNYSNGEATFKQLRKYGDIIVLHPLNSKYEDIEMTAQSKYRIVGKLFNKEKRY